MALFVSSSWRVSLSVVVLLLVVVLLASPLQRVSSAVTSVADVLSQYASASVSVPSHRDISALHVLDAYVVYDGLGSAGDVRSSGSAVDGLSPLPHFHPLSSHQFRSLSIGSGLPQYEHRPSPTAQVSSAGSYQPFPSTVVLSFDAFSIHFSLPLRRVPALWVSNASVTVRDGEDATVDVVSPLESTYWALDGDYLDDNWAVATLREDGRFHAVIQHEGEVYQADPIEHFKADMDAQHFHTLATSSQRGMAIYRHRDLINQHDKQCGSTDEHVAAARSTDSGAAGRSDVVSSNETQLASESSSASRRLHQLRVGDEYPTAPNLAGMNIFSIFPGSPQRMPYTFVVDAGFYSMFNSVADVQAAVTAVVAASNIILLKQTQLYIQINALTVMTTPNPPGGPNPWNQASYPAGTTGCPNYNINQQTIDMSDYRNTYHPRQGASHHLFTNCWPAPGTVGESYIGYTCLPDNAVSVSSYNAPFWQTVVHEIGHSLGAQHTFNIGGIMDYFVDSRYPLTTGPYQFAPQNEAQIQAYVVWDKYNPPSTMPEPFCQQPYVAVCGNGVVEPGEACDDSTGCCTSKCQLASGAQCSGTSTCCTAQCQYAPSSVSCGAGGGFCANGLCQLSSCPPTLPYCGLDPSTGGCRQSCSGAGLCSSTAWSQNLNLPDGTVCSSQGGVCSAGQCVSSSPASSSTVTYAWTSSTWPTTCPCTGNATRSVSCVGTSGGASSVYSDSYCLATGQAKPSTWQSCSVPASCFPYSWQYSSWSSCSASCDGGVTSRTAACYWESSPPVPVASSYCSSLPQSTTVQACNQANCTYEYVESNLFSACTASCGGGTQTRSPPTTCQRLINGAWQTMPLSSCQQALHYSVDDTQTCNEAACDTYAWQYSAWSACSAACGGGVASRVATCWDVTSNAAAASPSQCSALASAVTSESCNSAPCPSYEYVYGAWSACSATCGGGVATRTAQCIDSVSGLSYDLSACEAALGSPANTSVTCNRAACPSTTYEWQWSAWGACPVMCGGGNQSRQVACVSLTPYMPVASHFCPASTMPASHQACGQKSCNIYSWSITAWSVCSAECGGGTQTRAVYCQNFWTGTLSAPSTCTQYMTSPEPATAQACNQQACPAADEQALVPPADTTDPQAQWLLGTWSTCDVECGGGWQYRSVECASNTTSSSSINNSNSTCNMALAPASRQSCNVELCPAVWQTSSWSSCSAECGGGWMNRSVECVSASGGSSTSSVVVVDSARCSGVSRPLAAGECNFAPCPSWHYSDWSTCSAQCGQGVSRRTAVCTRYDGLVLSPSHCSADALESTSRACEQSVCPHWHVEAWSDCDKPCGGGSQHRTLTCRLPHSPVYEGREVARQQCTALLNVLQLTVDGPGASADEVRDGSGEQAPPTSRTCNAQSCPAYYWNGRTTTGRCSVECGGGVESIEVGCYSAATDEQVDDMYCRLVNASATLPAPARPCNVQSCDGPRWVSGEWSECTAVCGAGLQQRSVVCRDAQGRGATVDDTYCSTLDMPSVEQSCWVDERRCWGVSGVLMDSVRAGQAVNGVCSVSADTPTRHECVCRPGYSGQYCQVAASIDEVRVSSRSVVAGDVLTIEWSTVSDLPLVSVSLHRAGSSDWAIAGESLVALTPNYGSFSWSVPVWLEAASDYYVRVSYSASVYGDSGVWSVVSSACASVECGEHGQCGVHGQCQCTAGWSGSDCSVSPCDALRCNWEHAVECNALSWLQQPSTGNTSCSCLDGWSGPLCATPPQCANEPVCRHGGDTDLSTVFVDYSSTAYNGTTAAPQDCGRCKCAGRWQGTTCEVCPITCANGGLVDAHCTRCHCLPGYYGSACQSRYYELTMQLLLGEALTTATLDSVAAVRRLEQSAATELAWAAGIASLTPLISVAVTAEPSSHHTHHTHVRLRTRVAYSSSLIASFDVGQALLAGDGLDGAGAGNGNGTGAIASVDPQLLGPYRQAAFDNNRTAARDLLAAYTALTSMLSDADSRLFSGPILQHIDTHDGQWTVYDPTGRDSAALANITIPQPTSRFVAAPRLIPSQHSSSSSSSSTAAAASTATGAKSTLLAAVTVVAAVLAVLFAVLCGRYRGKLQSAAGCLACPVSVGVGVGVRLPAVAVLPVLRTSVSAPPASPPTTLPTQCDLEMVQSANSSSELPSLDYYQRSISDSSVAYRNICSPEPQGDGYAMHDDDEQQYDYQHGGGLRRATSMDELPEPPTLEPQLSSA